MEVIQFPPAKGLLYFDGLGSKIDVEEQRESFAAIFTSVQVALHFCNKDHVKAEKAARALIDADVLDVMRSDLVESVEYLESVVAIMRAALARLEISEERALRATRK